MSEVQQFFRVRFCKQGDVRFTSHHDMMRLFERVLRRARLPVAMSKGFNPRPRMSLPAALGVGVKGCNEVLDFEFSRWVAPEDVKRRLAAQLPDGIFIKSLQNPASKPDRRAKHLSYRVPLLEGHPVTDERIQALLARREFTVERRRKEKVKTVNIRPFIRRIRLRGDELHLLLDVTQAGTARPDEVARALGLRAGVHYLESMTERTHVNLSSSL